MHRTDDWQTRMIACSCGAVFRGEEEALYSLVSDHIDRLHPEQHRPVHLVGIAAEELLVEELRPSGAFLIMPGSRQRDSQA